MQSSLEAVKILAYVWPLELDLQNFDSEVTTVCDIDQILNYVECDAGLIWVVYPLLSQRELQHPQLVTEWLNFYAPLVALRNRGVDCLVFKAKDSVPEFMKNEDYFDDSLLVKLGCQIHPDAFEIQDQLELFACDLNRPPVFSPKKLDYNQSEINRLILGLQGLQQAENLKSCSSTVSDVSDNLYKEKSELLLVQLQLLQAEFAQLNEELNHLRRESLLTADLILKAGGRLVKNP